jgi:hypothetical protein
VAKNAEASFDEPVFLAIPAGILRLQKSYDGLREGKSAGHGEKLL